MVLVFSGEMRLEDVEGVIFSCKSAVCLSLIMPQTEQMFVALMF
jgi:hypothetical protein